MSPKLKLKLKRLWRLSSSFELVLLLLLLLVPEARSMRRGRNFGHSRSDGHEARGTTPDADPMEPCYLSNNRASESLTISESTPVGTVVGEIMVSYSGSVRNFNEFPAAD